MEVFLSYNRRDTTHAAALQTWLGGQGVTTFFDQRDLAGGKLWLPMLDAAFQVSPPPMRCPPHGRRIRWTAAAG